MPYTPFSDFAPDNAQLNEDSSAMMSNVLPAPKGFSPVPALVNLPRLPEACISIWGYPTPNEETFILVASSTHIYRFLTGKWIDVTRQDDEGNIIPYHVSPEIGWSFINFQQIPMCAGLGDAPQIWDTSLQRFRNIENKWQLPNPTAADRKANPSDNPKLNPVPWGRAIAANNEFVFILAADEKPSRIYQSGTRQPEVWQVGQQDAAYNDFDVGGEVMAVSQGTSPIILLKKGIYQAHRTDVSGAFSFLKISTGIGCFYYGSAAILNDTIFFLDEYGFYALSEQGEMRPIGFNKVNNWIRDVLTSHIPDCRISAFADEKNMRIYWSFIPNKTPIPPNADFPTGNDYSGFSLVYDVLRDEWVRLLQCGSSACVLPWRAISLDDLTDPASPDNKYSHISLDSTIFNYGANIPAFLSKDGMYVQLQAGVNDAAFMQTAYAGDTAQNMILINKIQPIIENPNFDVEARIRGDLTMAHTPFYSPWARQSRIDGAIRCIYRGRTAKIQIRLPFGAEWNKAQGVDVDVRKAGIR